MILRAISSFIATRDSLTLTITFPAREFTTVTVAPTVKPQFSRWCFTSSLPPIFLMTCSFPASAKTNGINSLSIKIKLKDQNLISTN